MTHRKRILLIEDEEDIASLIKLQAEVSGYKLHVEVDGINGYRAVEREKPDLVILDIMLPALIFYNYLKNAFKYLTSDMEDLLYKLLSTLELQYRKPSK